MRLFKLASVVAPVVIALCTLAPSSATAAPSAAGKRIAKRAGANAAPPRVLPAPLPKAEVLPPLPPVARDVTAITTLTSASIADGWTGGSNADVTPASATAGTSEPLPTLPPATAAAPAVAPRSSPDVVHASGAGGADVKPSGFVFQVGTGALVPATSFVSGVDALGPGISFDVRLGYYATPHVGVLIGFRGSYGHRGKGCSDSCDGYSLQAPVMLQFAQIDRTRGLYGEIGVGLGTTYGASTKGAVYTLTSPAELKLGAGYRFAGAGGVRRATAVDINLGVDLGSITSAEVHTGGETYSGSVDGTTHLVLALSVISHFSL